MTKTLETFRDQDMPNANPDNGVDRPKTDAEMTYLKTMNIDEAIRQKQKKKYVYETNMHNINNLIVGQIK